MALDAIARLYDVEKNLVKLEPGSVKERYQAGTITFPAKAGKSIDLEKLRASIAATRLSGYTNMRVDYLEVTVRGKIQARDKVLVLKVSGSPQEFVLAGDDRTVDDRLRAAAKQGENEVTLTGRVDGWNGRFPVILRALAERYGTEGQKPMLLLVGSIEGAGK